MDKRDKDFLATNLKGLVQDMLEWMELRNQQMKVDWEFSSTPAEAKLFAALRGQERTVADLARALGISRQAVHANLKRMIQAGFLESVPHPHSNRDKLIRITAEGRKIQSLAAINLRQIEEEIKETIGETNVENVRRLFVKHLKKVGSLRAEPPKNQ